MTNPFGTRNDCVRDNVKVEFPGSSSLGFSLKHGHRGSWLVWEQDDAHKVGRMVGRVTCEGVVYAEVLHLTTNLRSAHVRWVDPASVRLSYAEPPRSLMEFMCGAWNDAETPLRRAHHGFLPEEARAEWRTPSNAVSNAARDAPISRDELRTALREVSSRIGRDAAERIVKVSGNAVSAGGISPERYRAVFNACTRVLTDDALKRPTQQDIREALREVVYENGLIVAQQIVKGVGRADDIDGISPEHFRDVLTECDRVRREEPRSALNAGEDDDPLDDLPLTRAVPPKGWRPPDDEPPEDDTILDGGRI